MAKTAATLRYGCLGCLGLVGLVLLTVALLLGVAALTARPERVEDRVATHAIPVRADGKGHTGGRVVLEIREAELHVEPVSPGEPLRIEARYDVNAFALDEGLD